MQTNDFDMLLPQARPLSSGLSRFVDCTVALVGLVVASPFIAIAGILVWLTGGSPVFFRQQRIGLRGAPFTMYKLRTMPNITGGTLGVTASDDARVTAVGRFLRKTKLDELPELWNVLRGDMALVGPRPEVPRYVDMTNPAWQATLQVRPGLTDPVTLRLLDEQRLLSRVKGGHREKLYLAALLPWKLSEYVSYINRRTWQSDCGVIWKTALAAFHLHHPVPPSLDEVLKFANREDLSQLLIFADSSEQRAESANATPTIRRRYHMLADATVFAAAFVVAYLLRFEFAVPPNEAATMLQQILYVMAIQVAAMWFAGAYSLVWRYIGIHDVSRFMNAAMGATAPLVFLRAVGGSHPMYHVPISVIAIDTMLAFGGALTVRVLRRSIHEMTEAPRSFGNAGTDRKRVLLIGAGQAGRMVLSEMRRNHPDTLPVGFVDDDAEKVGMNMHGVKVLGTTEDVPKLVAELKIDHVIITIAQGTRSDFRRILDICESASVKVRVIPSLSEILLDKVKVSRIRDLQVEDLLGRAPVDLNDPTVQSFVHGKVVMVTGAGGSIGSELARQIAHCGPKQLLLVERAEPALFNVHRALKNMLKPEQLVPLASDICNTARMRQVFGKYRPEIVVHAAAHKHVPLMEENIVDAVVNNVIGTRDLAEISGEFGAEVFVMVSTDKAVRPASIMGATKRAAEVAIQEAQSCFDTRYVAVRFGNVIGSTGSVIQIFSEQVRAGGPVTVTDPAMKRYFMTVSEASQLVLHAASMGEGGEVFVLDMGEPVRILDVAKDVITLSGLRPFEDIDIVFTGARPGEKLFEEIELRGEEITRTEHPKIFSGKFNWSSGAKVAHTIGVMRRMAMAGASEELVRAIEELVPEAELRQAGSMRHAEVEVLRRAAM